MLIRNSPSTSAVNSVAMATETSDMESNIKDLIKFEIGLMREDINKKLEEIYKVQLISSEDIKLIKKKVTQQTQSVERVNVPEEFTLPIKTKLEFDELEEKLTSDAMKTSFIVLLSSFGGANTRSIVHCIMNGVMTPHLAINFSLRGKSKVSFSTTTIFTCIVGK